MKLIREFVDIQDLEVLKEDFEKEDGTKDQILRLKGPFMVADDWNKNKRKYPKSVLEREVKKYNEEKISKNRAVGTCDHEDSPQISLERISHIIESLEMQENNAIGVARVIDTPTGKILKTLVNEGIILGMSSRGIGELNEDGTVKDSYQLLGVDVVMEPSANNCFVEGILENKEYIMDGDQIVEVAVKKLQKEVDKKFIGKSSSGHTLGLLLDFIDAISLH